MLVTAKGGATFTTSEFTLDVGCTPSLGLAESASFVPLIVLSVGDSVSSVYTYIPPVATRSYCQPTSVTLQGVTLDSAPNPLAVAQSASCLVNPCFDFDISSTASVSTFKFNIRTFFGPRPDVFFDSSQITIEVNCNTNTISSSVSVFAFSFY